MSSICTVKYMLRSSLCFSYQNLFQNLKSKTEIINYSRYSQKTRYLRQPGSDSKVMQISLRSIQISEQKTSETISSFPPRLFLLGSRKIVEIFFILKPTTVPINMKMDMQNSKRLWLEGRWLSRLDVIMSNALLASLCFDRSFTLHHFFVSFTS